MAANRIQLQNALHKPYDRVLFSREVLSPVFGSGFTLNSSLVQAAVLPNKSEAAAIDKVWIYGNILLDDSTEITCYEVLLQPTVRIEHSKVAIQQYIRKLLTAGQAALINFVAPANKNVWRLTLVAKDSVLTEKGVKEKTTNAKRYTFLLGPSETCKTAAERFEFLSTEKEINFQTLVNAFSVEKLSKAFFDEYTLHYQNFCDYLQESNYRKSVFNISFPANATKEEKDKASKPIRDFVKKLLGRIVFLYFVQKKGWLGASDTNYSDGLGDFIKRLFKDSGGNNTFYSNWLTVLFFDTLNKERKNDDFKMPDGKIVKVPFLNGGLFDKEEFDEHLLTFKSKLFHHPDFEDDILTAKSNGNSRGFLDFLDGFNFTVYEDSPDDHTVAVDPEMLGHIFENLLEDNKDKGAFYTPKEIVHYMCQESLTEYLCSTLQIKDEVAEREAVTQLLKNKLVDNILKPEIVELEKALDNVKICDPAIGSGAFPMGLLQEILSIKELIAYESGKEWKPAETKLNIIQNSIYGVDIEKGAVDIARLRFWLSLVVDEEAPKALPNLDYKIVVGNSLVSKLGDDVIDIDWNLNETSHGLFGAELAIQKAELLKKISKEQKEFFNPKSDKKKLAADIRTLKIDLLINQLELMVKTEGIETRPTGNGKAITKQTERYLETLGWKQQIEKLKKLKAKPEEPLHFFDWKLDFPEVLNPNLTNDRGGFDIVIGNPPYIGEKGNEKIFHDVNKTSLGKLFYTRWMDYFYFFFHLGIDLMNNRGSLAFITTNYYFTSTGGNKLRFDLNKRTDILSIINFNELKIFETATGQHNSITIISKLKSGRIASNIEVSANRESINNRLTEIFNRKDSKSKYCQVCQEELFEGIDNQIRITGVKGIQENGLSVEGIVNKMKYKSKLLGDITKVLMGLVSRADTVSNSHLKKDPNLNAKKGDGIYVLSKKELKSLNLTEIEFKEYVKPFYKNSDITRYYSKKNNSLYLLYIKDTGYSINLPLSLKQHFIKFKHLLTELKRNFLKNEIAAPFVRRWLEQGNYFVLFNPKKEEYFDFEKIVCPYRSKKNSFAYNNQPWYASQDVGYILPESKEFLIKYILAILNSKLCFHWLYLKGKRKGETLELYVAPLKQIPIKICDLRIQYKIENYVDKILEIKNNNPHSDTSSIEKELDILIYRLYDLTFDEVKVIDPDFNLNEQEYEAIKL